jgi:hypothetical protein
MPYKTLIFYQSILSVAVIEGSTTKRFTINRYPVVDILSFTSIVEIVFSLLSHVRLMHGIVIRSQANASLWYADSSP